MLGNRALAPWVPLFALPGLSTSEGRAAPGPQRDVPAKAAERSGARRHGAPERSPRVQVERGDRLRAIAALAQHPDVAGGEQVAAVAQAPLELGQRRSGLERP